jgi:hypothetical protein
MGRQGPDLTQVGREHVTGFSRGFELGVELTIESEWGEYWVSRPSPLTKQCKEQILINIMRYNIQCTWIEEKGMETSEFGVTVAKKQTSRSLPRPRECFQRDNMCDTEPQVQRDVV